MMLNVSPCARQRCSTRGTFGCCMKSYLAMMVLPPRSVSFERCSQQHDALVQPLVFQVCNSGTAAREAGSSYRPP